MSISDPNREQLVRVARALGDFRSEVVFVGGATLGLLVSDPAAPMVRPTDDVDVVPSSLPLKTEAMVTTTQVKTWKISWS